MGSRIMHLLIANRIADSLSIKDKTPFYLEVSLRMLFHQKIRHISLLVKYKTFQGTLTTKALYINIDRKQKTYMYLVILHI